MFVEMSFHDRLVCFVDSVGMTLLAVLFLLPLPNCLLRVCFLTLCCCFKILPTTNNLCNFWRSKFQQINIHKFCSWDDTFTQERNCGSPNNLCKCTESLCTLSTNTFYRIESLLVWKQPPCSVFFVRKECWRLF